MSGETILVADDDRAIRTVLGQALNRQGYDVRLTGNAATLWNWVNDGLGQLVITDIVMPDGNGLDLLPQIKKRRPDLRVIVMSAQNTLLTAVKATEKGAFEYLPKPFDLTEVVDSVRRALTQRKESSSIQQEDDESEKLPLIGRTPAMQEVYRIIARLTATDLSALISGESGTGKELIAQALHDFSKRRAGPFIAINMAAIPKDLIESELFGHEKGAFTGATSRYAGRFEQAQGGTLFLDEIGDMPMEAQTRLLRVLQEGEYMTVGGRRPIKTDVRIVAATHRDIKRMVQSGHFREDLFYRLNVVPIRVPPLRERQDDIPDLIAHFLKAGQEQGLPVKTITPKAIECLKNARWSGNVRELENLVHRLAALYSQDIIDLDVIEAELSDQQSAMTDMSSAQEGESLSEAIERHLRIYFNAHDGDLPASGLYAQMLREFEQPLINLCLEYTDGNQIKAADILGLNRNTLRKKIRELGIPVIRGSKKY